MTDITEDGEYTLEVQGTLFKKMLNICVEENGNTPDIQNDIQRGNQFIFVAGMLKRGHRAHESFLKDALRVGGGFTSDPFYSLWYYREVYPIIFQEHAVTANAYKAKVYGEVYFITPKMLADVDYYEEKGTSTYRAKIKVDIPKPFGLKTGISCYISSHFCKKEACKNEFEENLLTLGDTYHKKEKKSDVFYNFQDRKKS